MTKKQIIAARDEILDLRNGEEWGKIVELVHSLGLQTSFNGTILICYADSEYELGNDVEAMAGYMRYLKLFPKGKAKNFALFNLGLCLSHIGMHEEALHCFQRTDESHPSREEMVLETLVDVGKVDEARMLLQRDDLAFIKRKS